MEWITWAAFAVFVATSLTLAAFLAVWMGQWALGSGWSRTSGALWLASLPLSWGGVMVAVRLFSWLQPGPEHVRGIGYALGVIALLIPLLGLLIAYAVTLLIAVILPGMAFLLAIVPFLLNGGTFHRQQRLRAGLGCWLLAVTLVGLVLIPAARSLVVGPKIEVFRVFHFVRGVASVPSR